MNGMNISSSNGRTSRKPLFSLTASFSSNAITTVHSGSLPFHAIFYSNRERCQVRRPPMARRTASCPSPVVSRMAHDGVNGIISASKWSDDVELRWEVIAELWRERRVRRCDQFEVHARRIVDQMLPDEPHIHRRSPEGPDAGLFANLPKTPSPITQPANFTHPGCAAGRKIASTTNDIKNKARARRPDPAA